MASGRGYVTTLQILTVLDVLAALAMVGIARVGGWPVVDEEGRDFFTISALGGLWVLGALVLRLIILTVMAQWAKGLSLPSGRPSLAQDWFVPGVSLFAPLQTLLAANTINGATPAQRRLLILVWWLARWLTCGSGFVVAMMVMANILPTPTSEDSNFGTVALGWLAIATLIAKPLEFAVIAVTHRHQSLHPDLAADHF